MEELPPEIIAIELDYPVYDQRIPDGLIKPEMDVISPLNMEVMGFSKGLSPDMTSKKTAPLPDNESPTPPASEKDFGM